MAIEEEKEKEKEEEEGSMDGMLLSVTHPEVN